MKQLTLDEIKTIEIKILDFVDSICKENNFVYFLAWGTLLGAVRHNGFIPWDDDIDIVMPRKDYESLIELIQKSNNDRYKVLCYKTDSEYFYPFAKVVDSYTVLREKKSLFRENMGIYLDIFPLDNLPQKTEQIKLLQRKCWTLRQVWGHALTWELKSFQGKSILYKAMCYLCSLYSWRRAIVKLNVLASKESDTYQYVAELVDSNRMENKMPSDWFSNSVEVLFEGKNYPAPKGFSEYLTYGYGDYMTLPPVEKRVSDHNYDAFLRDSVEV